MGRSQRLFSSVPSCLPWLCFAACAEAPPPMEAPRPAPDLASAAPVLPAPRLYPTPQLLWPEGTPLRVSQVCVELGALPQHETLAALVPELIEDAGLLVGPPAGCDLSLRFVAAPPALRPQAAAAWDRAGDAAERFIITPDARAPDLRLYAASERGALHALRRALALVSDSAGARWIQPATIVDFPSFPERGVVEGFYGPYYSRADRQHVMGLMGQLLMSSYVYGPKGDPYCYTKWYAPYPAAQAADLRAGAAWARRHLLSFRWAISPAWEPLDTSVKYSSDEDLARLRAKLAALRDLGVTEFAVFIDDTREALYWPEDQARFKSLAEAHVFFLNRVLAVLKEWDPAARLLTVGSAYTNANPDWRAYNTVLGKGLHPDIDVMWTGPQVYSRVITAAHLATINQLLGRPVVLWDNAPVELAPISNRSADLAGDVRAYLFNPVVNEVSYLTIYDYYQVVGPQGDFLWNAGSYSPLDSFVTWYRLRGAP